MEINCSRYAHPRRVAASMNHGPFILRSPRLTPCGLMKPGSYLVNTARGPVVQQAAVEQALRSGRLMGFGTDVLEQEPPEAGNPLLRLPNVIVSPHSAASTEEGLSRMAAQAARNLLDALDGAPDPAMMVNPEILPSR